MPISLPCADKEKLLREWSRTAVEVAEGTDALSIAQWNSTAEYHSGRTDLEKRWTACEAARLAYQLHQTKHGC
jgi:hypothetical protein